MRTMDFTQKHNMMRVLLIVVLLAFITLKATVVGIERVRTLQALQLSGIVTHNQGALDSLLNHIDHMVGLDPDHTFRVAHAVMITNNRQYLWSYRNMKWVPICQMTPTPCLDQTGRIFLRPPD